MNFLLMKRLLAGLLLLGSLATTRSELLGRNLDLTPPPGWKRVAPFSPLLAESPYATLKYVTADGRRASIVVTLLPVDLLGFAVNDAASLIEFTLIAAEPFLPASTPIAFPVRKGFAFSVTAPALAPNSHRMTTTACLLLDSKHLVHVAISHDDTEQPEFQQAMQALRSMRLRTDHADLAAPATLPLTELAADSRQ
jgi:hypothetical protein